MKNCPICENETEIKFLQIQDYELLECKTCDHVFLDQELANDHVSRIYSDDYFEGGKDGYSNYLNEAPLLTQRGEYYANILKRFQKPGTILDIGAAAGFILKGYENKGWHGTGLEPNQKMAEYGEKHLNLDIINGSLETIKSAKKYNVVSMVQVVAHFYDINTAFKNISNLLETDGLLLIETWNKNSLIAKLSGKNWHEYSPPSVLNWFSKKSLLKLAHKHQFSLVASRPTLKKISLSHARSLAEHKSKQSLLFKIVDAFLGILPKKLNLYYPADDLFWMVLRKDPT